MAPGNTGGVLVAFVGLTVCVLLCNTILIYAFLPHHRGLRELLQGTSSGGFSLDVFPAEVSVASSPFDLIWLSSDTNTSFRRRTGSRAWEEWTDGALSFRFEQTSPLFILVDSSRANFAIRLTQTTAYFQFGDAGEWQVLGPGRFDDDTRAYKQVRWLAQDGQLTFLRPAGSASWYEMQGTERRFEFELVSWEGEGGVSVATLVDHKRDNISIRLNEFSASYRDHDENWNQLSVGRWTEMEGQPVLDVSGTPPKPAFGASDFPSVKIFVGLAAYREGLCGNTLKELFQYAKYPDRVSAGVVQQNSADDPDCLEDYCASVPNCRRAQVQVITVPLNLSRQVMPARFRQHLLLDHQDFCLQVDSHSAFEQDWDLLALRTWLDTDNEMAVLTAYPNTVASRRDQSLTPNRCSTQFSGHGLEQIVNGGNSAMNVPPGNKPNLVPFFGAGIGFARCHASLNVPYDPYLPFLMGGEEFNTAARLWTWGYDLYAPSRNFVYHYYNDETLPPDLAKKRKRSKSPWQAADPAAEDELRRETIKRWRALFGLPLAGPPLAHTMEDLTLFGLGRRRSLQAYLDFAGVNLVSGKLVSRCDELGRMRWRPYAFEEPFQPSGPQCVDPYKCCTNFARVRSRAEAMLNKTATQLRQEALDLEGSEAGMWSRSRPPILSDFATATCP